MPNNYYERLSEMNPGELADGLAIEQEFDAIGRGFAKLPEPHRDGKGFEGPTRVGDPVEETDAVNLATLEKLNLPIYRKKITTEDWNTITDAGIYDVVNASGENKAPGHPYGVLTVYKFNGVVTQIYYPDVNDSGVMAKRTCKNISLSSWAAWAVLMQDDSKSTCLVSAIGTGAPHETVVSQLPATVVKQSRYVLPNPFGNNTPVICWAELLINGVWARAGFMWEHQSTGSYGVTASYVQGQGIAVQTGSNAVCLSSSAAGGGHGFYATTITAQCRVFVRKLEA